MRERLSNIFWKKGRLFRQCNAFLTLSITPLKLRVLFMAVYTNVLVMHVYALR